MILDRFGGSWKVFWGSWGVLGGILGGLGDLLGGLGGLLGRLGGVLGGLRPAWVHFCRFKINRVGGGRPRASKKGPNMAPKMGAKTDQNRRRKKRCNKKLFNIVSGRSWSRLGAILGPSWPHLRPSWADFEGSGRGKIVGFR